MKKYTADFETCTWLENETYVWAWAVCEIGNENNIIIDNNIDSFINFCKDSENSIFYFHNLKFDCEFIIYWCLTHGFKHVVNKEDITSNTFITLISEFGQFYSMTIYFKKSNKKVQKVTFIDSLKILPFSVKKIAKSFDLEISKLKIDYDKPRKLGHVLTSDERDYIKNDVLIVAKALNVLFKQDLQKMTQGSNAVYDFKKTLTKSRYEHIFPELDYQTHQDIRQAYKGGFTYLNPIYKEKDIKNVTVLDINSLYPSVMVEKNLPWGEPIFFEGKYKEDKVYNLYIQMITCSFEIKKNKIPTIQIKNSMNFRGNEYLTSSNNEIICLVLTSVDLKLFLEQYNVYDLVYISGWKFKSMKGIFTGYIDKWLEVKNQATLDNNEGLRTLAKLMLNSLYGKLATSLNSQSKNPFLGTDGVVHYQLGDKEQKKGFYLPAGCFITAYAREKTIRTSQAITDYSLEKYNKDLYVYSDTDSIHTMLPIEELEQFCQIDNVKLGYWKNEGFATKAKFIRQKCYVEVIDNKLKIRCAGMPERCYSHVEYNNFKTGLTVPDKLTFKHVKGGVKLINTEFTIKEEKIFTNLVKKNK